MKWLLCLGSLADAELGTAAAVDPDAAVVDTPRLTLNAGRAADLPIETNVAPAPGITPVSLSVIGRTGDDLLLWWWWGGWPISSSSSAAEDELCAASTVNP
jgi:hypothetical protein